MESRSAKLTDLETVIVERVRLRLGHNLLTAQVPSDRWVPIVLAVVADLAQQAQRLIAHGEWNEGEIEGFPERPRAKLCDASGTTPGGVRVHCQLPHNHHGQCLLEPR